MEMMNLFFFPNCFRDIDVFLLFCLMPHLELSVLLLLLLYSAVRCLLSYVYGMS